MQKSIIRTYSAGVFFGEVINQENTPAGVIVTIKDCRRIWYWNGAASLSELAMSGVKRDGSKFSVVVPEMVVAGAIEIIPCTDKAVESIENVPVWKA